MGQKKFHGIRAQWEDFGYYRTGQNWQGGDNKNAVLWNEGLLLFQTPFFVILI